MLVRREDNGGVATLTLNRPEKLNAITPALMVDLRGHIDEIAGDQSVRCVILAGAGRSFCAGHDLSAIASGEQAPSKHYEPETIDALENLPQPTISKIHGHCFTGGLELALGCDLLVASESALLGDTHGQWGLAPIWGMSVRLPERIGPSRAKQLMFTSRRIAGSEAAVLGLVDRACPEDELDEVVSTLAREIAENSPGTNRIDKALLRDATQMTRKEALLHERELPYGVPEDMVERMRARSKKPRAERGPSS
jgi:enoyl-CoA hydratase/carnithine racemase